MPDMLVKLYELPPLQPALDRCEAHGYKIKRAIMPEMETVCGWVKEHFGTGWASECRGSFAQGPVSCYVAYQNGKMVGFACYDTTYRDFFGPTGVQEELRRGNGIGAALLLSCLHDMAAKGYGYAIIGSVGPAEFYSKVCGATVIPDSEPGIYRDML